MIAVMAMLVGISVITRLMPLFFAQRLQSSTLVTRLGTWLPPTIFILLIVQALLDAIPNCYALPEAAGIGVAVALHLWRRHMLLSLGGSVAVYLALTHWIGG